MVFVRGQSQDYDTWAQLGNRGWSYREVLPIFRDMESYQGDADDEYRGRNGPLKVTESNETGPLYDALIKAAGEVGIAYTKDYNGAKQDGIGMTQTTIRGGRRMSTAVCYLDPARARPNLTIQANALTECLLLEGKRCVGVRYTVERAATRGPRANREVIVSAGSINSPQLLELSGIGQPELLQGLGIEVRHALEGRRREPARSLFAAHEMDGAGLARHDLQRQGARAWHGLAGAEIRADPQGAARPAGVADPRLCPHPRRAGRAGRGDLLDPVPGRSRISSSRSNPASPRS